MEVPVIYWGISIHFLGAVVCSVRYDRVMHTLVMGYGSVDLPNNLEGSIETIFPSRSMGICKYDDQYFHIK